MNEPNEQNEQDFQAEPPALPQSRERHEALAAVEREIASLYGKRTRNLPVLLGKLRALL